MMIYFVHYFSGEVYVVKVSLSCFSRMFEFLQMHGVCNIFLDRCDGKYYVGFKNMSVNFIIVRPGAMSITVQNKEYVLVSFSSNGIGDVKVLLESGLERYRIVKYRGNEKQLPFKLQPDILMETDITKFFDNNCLTGYSTALYEDLARVTTLSAFKLIEHHESFKLPDDKVKSALANSDELHPARKIAELLSRYYGNVIRNRYEILLKDLVQYHYSNSPVIDILSSTLPDKKRSMKQHEFIGPPLVYVDKNKLTAPLVSLNGISSIYGVSIDLHKFGKWFDWLAKEFLPMNVFLSSTGLDMVKGAFKQAGIIGTSAIVTSNEGYKILITENIHANSAVSSLKRVS